MASIRREIEIAVKVETAWEALRDVGALHTRLARGFVTDTRMDGADRLVTFADGSTVRERIVDVDDAARRVVWSAFGTAMTHHNASAQVFDDEGCTRFVWIADLLPDTVAPRIAAMIEAGLAAIRRTLEGDAGY
jgi:hypothetical protein